MRESRIDSYKPGFKAPLYPWFPVAGILVALWLISEMGLLAIGFSSWVVRSASSNCPGHASLR